MDIDPRNNDRGSKRVATDTAVPDFHGAFTSDEEGNESGCSDAVVSAARRFKRVRIDAGSTSSYEQPRSNPHARPQELAPANAHAHHLRPPAPPHSNSFRSTEGQYGNVNAQLRAIHLNRMEQKRLKKNLENIIISGIYRDARENFALRT